MKIDSLVTAAIFGFGYLLLAGSGAANAGEVKLMSAEVMRHVGLNKLGGEFERISGHKLTIIYDSAGGIGKRIQAGEIADVVIMQKPAVEAMSERGTIARESIVNLARSGLAMAVRKGAPKPDISSVDAFKRALLAAKSIAHPDPKRGAASGVYFRSVIERLGISQEVQAKAKLTQPPLAEFVAQTEFEILVTQAADILSVPSLDLVGWLPDELQDYNAFTWTAGVTANAKEPDAAKALIQFLSSPTAAAVIKKQGMEPIIP
jgi:molybdate transport system substrate-binding protein